MAQANYTKARNALELKYITRMIGDAIRAGHTVTIECEGEELHHPTTDIKALAAEATCADITRMCLATPTGEYVGSVLIVNGNGCDWIADHTADCVDVMSILPDYDDMEAEFDAIPA